MDDNHPYSCRSASRKKENSRQIDTSHGIGRPSRTDFQLQSFHRDGLDVQESSSMDLASIGKATNNFSNSNFIGKGGFGPVYKQDHLITKTMVYLKFSIIVLSLLSLAIITQAQDPTFLYNYCPNTTTYTRNSTYQANLNLILSSLSSNATRSNINGFYNVSAGQAPDVVYGMFLCRGDVSNSVCQSCVNFATKDVLEKCPIEKVATIWYDECELRYSNRNIFSTVDQDLTLFLMSPNNVTVQPDNFNQLVATTLNNISTRAASAPSGAKKFAVQQANYTGVQKLYTLVQCTPDLSNSDCSRCLEGAISKLGNCCNRKQGGRVIFASCNFRYELYEFYNATAAVEAVPAPPPVTPSPPPASGSKTSGKGKGGVSTVLIIAIVIPVAVSLVLFFLGFCFLSRRAKNNRYSAEENDVGNEITNVESLQFDLRSIEDATNHFSADNKLGEGGFGEVYKVWKHWRDGTPLEVMDPTLTDTYSRSEIIRCIHIGLLCVQEDPASRPTMATVVLMLNSYSITLALPQEPAFFLQSITDQGSIPSKEFFADQSKSKSVPYSGDEGSITEQENLITTTMDSLKLSTILLSLLSLAIITQAQDPTSLSHYCPNTTTYTRNSTYQANLNLLLSSLSSNSTRININGFYNVSAGKDPDEVYGMFLCRGDVSNSVCRNCVNFATKDVLDKCPIEKVAMIWYDECELRYSNRNIFSTVDQDATVLMSSPNNVTVQPEIFNQLVETTIYDIAVRASSAPSGAKKFAVQQANYTGDQKLYTLVQCTPDLSTPDCRRCLEGAISKLGNCCNRKQGGRVIFASCNFRYELYEFYNATAAAEAVAPPPPVTPSPPPASGSKTSGKGKGGVSTVLIIAIVIPFAVSLVLFFLGFCFLSRRAKNNRYSAEENDVGNEITNVESLQFDLSSIEDATNHFSADKKLGEGGFGEVYKVWRHWRDGTPLDVMDPTLTDTYSRSEIIRCIHIGLLCVQEDPASRPTMATIVLMLNSYSITLALPQEPAFFLHSRTEQGSIPSKEFFADQSKSKSVPYSGDKGSITEKENLII
ncbi:hypothetical protein SADUNF_Sadunf11G0014200 [Salix dunnii]|uniref:Gnk2-homologous domain-containing protein n=1 Tax=Salix dunnii TaxID=1413687 RepID=A0A835JPC4_9ROSI|nr:hypothetical protein SADUNF_Sadunf11G0014200 [Salix dunnii]